MKKYRGLLIFAIGLAVALVAKIVLSNLLGVEYVVAPKTIAGWDITIIFGLGWTTAAIIIIVWLIGYASCWLTRYFKTKRIE